MLLLAQEPAAPPAAVDRLFLQDRTELKGEILQISADGRLRLKLADLAKPVEFGMEELARLRFTTDEARPSVPGAEQVRLAGGGIIGGRVTSFDGESAVVESAGGPLRLRRKDLKALLLSAPEAPLPELQDTTRDVLIREVDRKPEGGGKAVKECVADYGFLRSIGEKVKFQVATPGENGAPPKVEEQEFDRAGVRHVYLYREAQARELPSGLFAKLTMKNGDRWVATLLAVGKDRVKVFSHFFGTVELPKERIHTISFTQQAQLTGGNLLITDLAGIHEYDPRGKEIWTYTAGAQGAAVARKLPSGAVLVADPNINSVYEIRPVGRTGGETGWRLDDVVQYPRDVARLDNGNTLIVQQYNGLVVEIDPRNPRTPAWQTTVQYSLSVQRLDGGNTLICTTSAVIEVNRGGAVQWTADLRTAGIRPYRASRLDNGNTLIVDQQKGQVVEIDARSTVVWKASGFSQPAQALRMEDGNTLILEQGANRVVEVDPINPKVKTDLNLRGLSQPQGMSTY